MNETKEHLHPAAPEAEGAPAEPKSEPSAEAAPEPAAEPVGEPAAQPSAAATTEENGDTEGTAQAAEPSGNGTEQKQEKEKKEKKRKKPRRKGWFITPLILLCILIAGIVGCMMNIAYCQSHFEVNFYQVESVRVASPIRIVVLSDVHLSEFGQDNDDLVHAAKSLHPDLIISAGDMVSYGKSEYGSMLTLSRRLSEIAPFYGVMGNHEDEKTFLEHDETMREKFAAAGMKLLINTCEKLKIKNTDIELVGVSGGKDEYDQYGGKKTMLDAILQSYFTVYTEKHARRDTPELFYRLHREACGGAARSQPVQRSAGKGLRFLRMYLHSGKRHQRNAQPPQGKARQIPRLPLVRHGLLLFGPVRHL